MLVAEFEPPVALVLAAAPVNVGAIVLLGVVDMVASPPVVLRASLVERLVEALVPFAVVLPQSTTGAMVAEVDTVPEGVKVPTVA